MQREPQRIAPAREFAKQVLAALGIEGLGVVSLDLNLSGNTMPMLTLRMFVTEDKGAAFVKLLSERRFQLVPFAATGDGTQAEVLS